MTSTCRHCQQPIHQLEWAGGFVHTGFDGAPWYAMCRTDIDPDTGDEVGGRPATPGARRS